jgi:hypothetical protein
MATTTEQHRYTLAEAAAFLGRDEQFVRESLANGSLVALPGQGITWEALLVCLETYNPRLATVIRMAQDSIDNGEYDNTVARLRELGIITPPDREDEETGDDTGPG